MTGPITLTIVLPPEMIEVVAKAVAAKLVVPTTPVVEREAPESPYMTVPEAAAYLRCSRQRVDDLLSSRRLARVKEGRRTLVRRDAIEAYLRTVA